MRSDPALQSRVDRPALRETLLLPHSLDDRIETFFPWLRVGYGSRHKLFINIELPRDSPGVQQVVLQLLFLKDVEVVVAQPLARDPLSLPVHVAVRIDHQ